MNLFQKNVYIDLRIITHMQKYDRDTVIKKLILQNL